MKIKIYKSKEKVKKAEFEIKRSWSGPVRGNDAFSQELSTLILHEPLFVAMITRHFRVELMEST